MNRIHGAWRLGAIVAIGPSCALPASAAAFELAGATYRGTHAAGGTIEFMVAADGSMRGRKVRATVSARTAPISICAAGRSRAVRS